jgi:hypothetical protein
MLLDSFLQKFNVPTYVTTVNMTAGMIDPCKQYLSNKSYSDRLRKFGFPERAGMTFVIGQNQRVIEVSFGLSENSLEAHLPKVRRHARLLGDDCHNQVWCAKVIGTIPQTRGGWILLRTQYGVTIHLVR